MIRLQEIYLVFVCLSCIGERKRKRKKIKEGIRKRERERKACRKKKNIEEIEIRKTEKK